MPSAKVLPSETRLTTSKTEATTSETELPTEVARPAEPLSPEQRRQRSIDNLQRIADALEEYVAANGAYPPPAILDIARQPLLSWRVHLLPYLGYDQLYQQFHLDESWDSRHNRRLLASIPPEFQSPERFDERTNYLLPVGSVGAFPERRGLPPRSFEDGLPNTVILLEVDDQAAVPWTQPAEYDVAVRKPCDQVGQLREGTLFLVWGGGTLSQVAMADAAKYWKAMFSTDGGEKFSASMVHQPPTAEVSPPAAAPDIALVSATAQPDTAPLAAPRTSSSTPVALNRVPNPSPAASPSQEIAPLRAPVPSEAASQSARQVLRATYGNQYDEAKTTEERRDLARKLLEHAARLEHGSAERYVALELCWKIAIEAGDLATALRAAEETAGHFNVDALETKSTVLAATARTRLPTEANDLLLTVVDELTDEAITIDNFEIARRLNAAAIAAARRKGDRQTIAAVSARQQEIDDAKSALAAAAKAIETLTDDPTDARANRIVGSYYCFAKERWDDGLPMLAQGDDAEVAQLARVELSRPTEADRQVALADAWWNLDETRSDFRAALRRRAAFWYRQAVSALPAGLDKVRAEMRLHQAER